MNHYRLVSFDITSLSTNIPLSETIESILEELYKDPCDCPWDTTSKHKTGKCQVCSNRRSMKWMLETATSQTYFHFKQKIYSQCNRISMGSPLGPLLADIFVIHLENKLMQKLKDNGLTLYKRYVDDVFATVKEGMDIEQLKQILNSFHPSR